MTKADPNIPTEDDAVGAIKSIMASHPEFGVKRILNSIRESHKDWSISEKRGNRTPM
jgi:hypothetical protein